MGGGIIAPLYACADQCVDARAVRRFYCSYCTCWHVCSSWSGHRNVFLQATVSSRGIDIHVFSVVFSCWLLSDVPSLIAVACSKSSTPGSHFLL